MDFSTLPPWAIVVLGTAAVVVGAVTRPSVAKLIERLAQIRTNANIVREQRRMAALAARTSIDLDHAMSGGQRLIVRHTGKGPEPLADLEER